jgi:hypothetical protein
MTPEYDAARTLFLIIAKKLNATFILNNPDISWKYYSTCPGAYINGNTHAQRMENYMCGGLINCDGLKRIQLMKSLFQAQSLSFTDDVMPLYYAWLPSYQPTTKTNRYIKMNEFIRIHSHLFQTI